MKRIILAILLTGLFSAAFATPDFLDAFIKNYKLTDTAPLAQKKCAICHVSEEDTSFNPYGKDVKAELKKSGAAGVDAKVLAAVGSLSSNGDGVTNADKIAKGVSPGDPAPGAPPAEPKKEEFPPKNGFHPAIVHFPIALFLGGIILDFIGMVKKDQSLLRAGWYNLILAAFTAFGGIASGAFAIMLQKLPLSGTVLQHMTMAVGSTFCMLILVTMRIHRHDKMNIPLRVAYYVLAAAAVILISWAGHVGGNLVYS